MTVIPKTAWKHYNGTKQALENGKHWRGKQEIIYAKGRGDQECWGSWQGLLHMPKMKAKFIKLIHTADIANSNAW